MTPEECAKITAERLAEWANTCNQQHATPAMMLAIGHDEHSGDLHLFAPENLAKRELLALIRYAYRTVVTDPAFKDGPNARQVSFIERPDDPHWNR